MNTDTRDGYCYCGCGQPTSIATHTSRKHGRVAGKPVKYIQGHNAARHRPVAPIDYLPEDCGHDTLCWIWQRATVRGYGTLKINGKTCYAHRQYFEAANGIIADGMELDHLCRIPACVNPDHLEPVTHAENLRRGKQTRLTVDEVRAIRTRLAEGHSAVAIAKRYGLGETTVRSIRDGTRWAGV